MTARQKKTLIRSGLMGDSSLRGEVRDGIQALAKRDRRCLGDTLHDAFEDSLNLDEALGEGHEQENGWAYLLGHGGTKKNIGLERHGAKSDEITTVINKKEAAQKQLRNHHALKKDGGLVVLGGVWQGAVCPYGQGEAEARPARDQIHRQEGAAETHSVRGERFRRAILGATPFFYATSPVRDHARCPGSFPKGADAAP